MKIKYNGIAPINNFLGDWVHGQIKDVFDDQAQDLGVQFEIIREPRQDNLSDKMERFSSYKLTKRGKRK
jgi:hypothetical protein